MRLESGHADITTANIFPAGFGHQSTCWHFQFISHVFILLKQVRVLRRDLAICKSMASGAGGGVDVLDRVVRTKLHISMSAKTLIHGQGITVQPYITELQPATQLLFLQLPILFFFFSGNTGLLGVALAQGLGVFTHYVTPVYYGSQSALQSIASHCLS